MSNINPKKRLFSRLPTWATWGLTLPLLVLNGWVLLLVFHYFQAIITIFILANLLAFILDYPVQFFVSHKVTRFRAIFWVMLGTLTIFIVLGITLIPTVIGQFNELLLHLPTWVQSSNQHLNSFYDWAQDKGIPLSFSGQIVERFSLQLQSFTGQILGLALGTLSRFVDFILIIVFTFYLLLHGDSLWTGILQWFPTPFNQVIRQILRQNFHNYYIGQATVSSLMGVCMTVAFFSLHVPYGLLFGLGIGFVAFFPFGGTVSITLVSLLMLLKDFRIGIKVVIAALVIQQVVENGIAPRLLGKFTGLNPIWVLIALLVGAQTAGVVGLLVAVPIAGSIKSLASERVLSEKSREHQC